MPAKKGQKFKSYTDEIRIEAIRLHLEEGWTYRRITEYFGIQDKSRMKKWMMKYKKQGEYGLIDQRSRREQYVDQDRYVHKLKRENEILKKCLKVWMQEVYKENTKPLRKPHNGTE